MSKYIALFSKGQRACQVIQTLSISIIVLRYKLLLQNDLQLILADVLYSRWIKIYSVHVGRTASFINVSRFLVQTVLEISRKINSHKQTNAIKYAK